MSPHHEERITDDKWKCAYEIFEHAVDLPAGERLAFARSALGDPEVINLAVELIEDVQDEDAQWPAALAPKPGDRIGRYEITGKLGQGGMGSPRRESEKRQAR